MTHFSGDRMPQIWGTLRLKKIGRPVLFPSSPNFKIGETFRKENNLFLVQSHGHFWFYLYLN